MPGLLVTVFPGNLYNNIGNVFYNVGILLFFLISVNFVGTCLLNELFSCNNIAENSIYGTCITCVT